MVLRWDGKVEYNLLMEWDGTVKAPGTWLCEMGWFLESNGMVSDIIIGWDGMLYMNGK